MLLLSPVPMVRGFGALLVIGIFVALACALTAGFAALIRFSERRPDVPPVLPRLRAARGRVVGRDRHERARRVAGARRATGSAAGAGARWTSRSCGRAAC